MKINTSCPSQFFLNIHFLYKYKSSEPVFKKVSMPTLLRTLKCNHFVS